MLRQKKTIKITKEKKAENQEGMKTISWISISQKLLKMPYLQKLSVAVPILWGTPSVGGVFPVYVQTIKTVLFQELDSGGSKLPPASVGGYHPGEWGGS